ncbi:Phage regulatory protein Rha (Phage_pRha) [Halomonas saccharevitans]|uniref:Phage regulatory protein Rha (Phage_pRha) n=1 Tax=Halomonas saccharevitans TaxID=416872 RepID=A0A1I6ZZY4_9GAMM|nr:Phage regulatory protein Rha (Phage_pRha) [Halomonas saccharevitans]
MSSREIAEVVEKRHDNVKRTIEMLATHGTVHPQIEDEPSTDAMGRTRITKTFHVNQRDSYVIVAQLSPEFTARLVDRWQELEQQVAQPKVPQSFARTAKAASTSTTSTRQPVVTRSTAPASG